MEDKITKKEITKIENGIFKLEEKVVDIEETFDTQDWHRDMKNFMADLNALMVLLHTAECFCRDIKEEHFEDFDGG
jgi:hypothetical protein